MILWLFTLLFPAAAFAVGEGGRSELAKGANAVIQTEETVFTVNSLGSGTTRFKTTVVILNENGNHRARLYVPYDKLSKVGYIKGASYDRYGKKIKTLKNNEIKDVSNSDDTFFGDNRLKIADLEYSIYPYTVEFEYEVTSRNMMFYPNWFPQDGERLSVEKATFEVLMPAGMKLRYRESNLTKKVAVSTVGTQERYFWEVSNLKPLETEPYGPSPEELVPSVLTAPNEFEVEGYKGSMATWKDLGIWQNKLNVGRDVLPQETIQKLKQLTANAKTEEDKVRLVYDYLQGKTRYVSIQLGIGGWQPFEASFVDTKGYGDCKALTNYTKAMLQAVGVNSVYALIKAGDNVADIKTDFPSSQFNHVLLMVPMAQDTMWLECTSQTEAAGYNGTNTGNRHALLITPEGGKLVKTTTYGATDNQQIRSINIKLDEKGSGVAKVQTLYTGSQQEIRDGVMNHLKPEEQRKWLYEQVKAPPFEISKYNFSQKKDRLPSVTENLELSLRQCATLSGRRMFVSPNLMNKWTYAPQQKAERLSDVVRLSAFLDVDTVEIDVPTGYAVEYLPGEISYKSVFGEYSASVEVEGQRVLYVRTMKMYRGRYKPETYAGLVEFLNNVIKADAEQVVFVKNVP
ncbi:hypothetical protein GCM10007389_31530 [Pontibacter akesuensis]|nr:hypothetical protein GCM10007389_31530 [Pontibacter akesuensis]